MMVAKPLSPREQGAVADALRPGEARLFWDQDVCDQRHALQVAGRTKSLGDPRVFNAALLHDVGKRHVRMGAVSRTLATVLDLLGLPMPDEWKTYRTHGSLGAADLDRVGASPLAIAFARGDAAPPAGIDEGAWQSLRRADDV